MNRHEDIMVPPVLNGLILCGGKSHRMQEDKSLLKYRGIPHWQYICDLLDPIVDDTWISCRKDQAGQFETGTKLLFDRKDIHAAGPAGGLLAAWNRFPDRAWLVVACDLPLVTAQSLTGLVNSRDPKSPATAFLNREKNWPEPLLAIWEPAGLQILAANAEMDRYCPRKTLEQCQASLVPFPNSEELFNANTPEDREQARRSLAHRPSPHR
ncbi:MAG TPA: NTP transferase domain-containing protein [Anseongella sp.]